MPDTNQTTPADLADFDLDAFIAGSVTPSTVVPITRDRTLGEKITEAQQRIVDLEESERNATAEGRPTTRRAGMVESPELEQARDDLAALTEEARGTFVFVRCEALTRKIRKAAMKIADGDADKYNLEVLSYLARVHVTDPRTNPESVGKMLTPDQWDDLAEAIGVSQYQQLVDALAEAAFAGVSPDFLQPASPSPNGGTSSKS